MGIDERLQRGGRPRKPLTGDPKIDRRREQYRQSQRRKYEKIRHDQNRCRRDTGLPCPLKDPEPRQVTSSVDGKLKMQIGQPFRGRRTMLTEDGRRVWYPSS